MLSSLLRKFFHAADTSFLVLSGAFSIVMVFSVFSVIFSQALLYLPGKKNEVSGLMIMGLFGGTVFPLAMGVASDTSMGQNGAIAVMTVGVLYLLYYTFRIRK